MNIADKLTTIAENVPKVYEAGKQARDDRFWNIFQKNGVRRNYNSGFAYWYGELFEPKYDLIANNSSNMFYHFNNWLTTEPINFIELCSRLNIKMDFSGVASTAAYMFYSAKISHLPEIDLSNAMNLSYAFNGSKISYIEKLKLSNSQAQTFSYTFNNCSALKHCIFEGTIAQNGFNVSSCVELDYESLLSILDCLGNKTDDIGGTEWVVTLGATNLSKLTDAEKASATQKGWTLA